MTLQQHPLSQAFPSMSMLEQADLSCDIRANGLISPIVLFEGQILDGWHRYRACLTANVEPRFVDFPEGQDPVAFVRSQNYHRRHMDAGQKAVAETRLHAWRPSGRPENMALGATLQENRALSNRDLAAEAGVSPRTIRQAKDVVRAGLGDVVRDGQVSLKRAAEIAKLPEPERQAAIQAPRPKPAPKPIPTAVGDDDALRARIQELETMVAAKDAQIATLKEQVAELADALRDAQEDNESLDRTIRAEDRLQGLMGEVDRFKEQARVARARVNGILSENRELVRCAKSWQRKAQKFERQLKGSTAIPDPEHDAPGMDEDDPFLEASA